MVRPNHVIAWAEFTLRGAPGTLEIFATSFRQIKVKTEKESYHLNAGSLALCHMVNPFLTIALLS